jgi:hypothetical protein
MPSLYSRLLLIVVLRKATDSHWSFWVRTGAMIHARWRHAAIRCRPLLCCPGRPMSSHSDLTIDSDGRPRSRHLLIKQRLKRGITPS